MPHQFEIDGPPHILFGLGVEARVADTLVQHGAQRVLLIADENHREGADRIAEALGDRAVGVFTDIAQHVPEDLAERARAAAREGQADWVLSHGGGTATGFAKAVALTEDVQLAAVPVTYAGSERTNIWGMRGSDGKKTGRDDRVRPSLVAYDPALTVGLPKDLSLMSLFNALGHVIGALSNDDLPEDAREVALEAASVLVPAIDAVGEDPSDPQARSDALYGAFLAASMVQRAKLGLQHALAHTLGGTYNTFHAAAHTAVLPYSTHARLIRDPSLGEALSDALGDDPGARLYDLARDNGQPHSLKGLDLTLEQMPELTQKAFDRGYPIGMDRDDLAQLVDDAYHARRPSRHSRRRTLPGEGPHAALQVTERGTPLAGARAVLIAIHGRGAAADRITRDFEAFLVGPPDQDEASMREGLCILAPQALDNSWYPHGFTKPPEENQPHLDSALSMVDAAWEAATAVVPPERVILAGFSQGGCLLLGWARSRSHTPGALLALSSAHYKLGDGYDNLAETRVHLAKSEGDPWIPQEVFDDTAAELQAVVKRLTVHQEPGEAHRPFDEGGADLRRAVQEALAEDG